MSTQGSQENLYLSVLSGAEAYRFDFDFYEWDSYDGRVLPCIQSAIGKPSFTRALKQIKSAHYLI